MRRLSVAPTTHAHLLAAPPAENSVIPVLSRLLLPSCPHRQPELLRHELVRQQPVHVANAAAVVAAAYVPE
jgi:hypothetical protein